MDKQKIKFSWDIHYRCNFRCPYCWFYRDWANMGRCSIYLTPDEWMAHWRRIYDKYGEVKIEIVGGEPFIYPDFIELVKKLSSIHLVKVTTNLSGDVERFAKEIDSQRVDLDLNFHILFIDLEAVIKKTLILKNAGFKCGVCYLAYPPQMYKIKDFSERFRKEDINFALAAFWGEYGGKNYPTAYTEEEKEIIRPFLGDIDRITYHLNAQSPKGKLCNAGYRYAGIQGNGNVVRCGPLGDKSIGNIMNENFKLLSNPLPCEADLCPCNEYICLLNDEKPDKSEIKTDIRLEPQNINEITILEKQVESPNIFLNNKKLNEVEILTRKTVLDSNPLRLGIIVTNWCNLRCIMCPTSRHEGGKTISQLSLSKIKELLPYLERIDWQGGEFFDFKYVKDMFYALKKYPNITHEITTNGLSLDKEWIELLLELNTGITFSIDSPIKETYEYIRKKGNFNKLLENINLIIELEQKYKKRLRRNITIVVMKSNYCHLTEFIPFVQKYGFGCLIFNPVMFLENEENIFKNQNFNIEYLNEVRNFLQKRLSELHIGFIWSLPSKCCQENIKKDATIAANNTNLYCTLPWKSLWISADRDGEIFPDCWCNKPVGNINHHSLLEVWNNEKMQLYRKRIIENDVGLCNVDCINGYSALVSSKNNQF